MGEMLLGHLRGDLPVVIVRPSIITSILNDPLSGWTEGIKYHTAVRDKKKKDVLMAASAACTVSENQNGCLSQDN
jgi:hypothetical protein